ncbi:MAG: carbamoyl-phosphate synthase large subunit, partial [Bdellovibrionales bacterium]|nr:carbamoyl-phosphate synthase large subunit [Bdellovibrionales bacterium]
TPACFEPSIDYTVVKIPRFTFEKFPLADDTLGTQMKSVGEAMAFGRDFSEAFQKALCSLELDSVGFDRSKLVSDKGREEILEACCRPTASRAWIVGEAIRSGIPITELYETTGIDPWFLEHLEFIILQEESLRKLSLSEMTQELLSQLKQQGFSDARIATLLDCTESEISDLRERLNVQPCFRLVDTCAAEFRAYTPYLYSSYEPMSTYEDCPPTNNDKIIILGSGPNRIGQGIEFDYCCVHAVLALREDGYEAIMVNCNPETVSTDYDISDRLYFEPLSFESVLNIVKRESPKGVIVQFGGQTPLKLANALSDTGVPILGTSVDAIDRAEDRERFSKLVNELGFKQPPHATARSLPEALKAAEELEFPLMIRPSFVLGGRAMKIVFSEDELREYMAESVDVSHDRPVLLDRFLDNAIEVDLDAVCDGTEVVIAGVMEHIERAGIHSGDSSCCLPPQTLSQYIIDEMKNEARQIALKLGVRGLMNIQFAVTPEQEVYLIEVNPRASRTVPFVSKATGIPWAKVAARVMAGKSLSELNLRNTQTPQYTSIKGVVFPFEKFPGVDTILGPEMKSTGEVMGISDTFSASFAKAEYAANVDLPTSGKAFLSVLDRDKPGVIEIASQLRSLGFEIVATRGTAEFLQSHDIDATVVNKVREGGPHIVDLLG